LLVLEPVREYALEQLQARGEADAAHERHAATYLELAERASPELRGLHERDWLPRLDREHANLLVALRWLIDRGDGEGSQRLVTALNMFWWIRGFMREGLERIREALALPSSSRVTRARALAMAGADAFWLGDLHTARDYEYAALDLYGDDGPPVDRAFAITTLGSCALSSGEVDVAEPLYEQMLTLSRLSTDARGVAHARMQAGTIAFYRGQYEPAYRLLMESIAALRETGDVRTAAYGLRTLVMLHCRRGDFSAAQACVHESLVMWQAVRGRVLLPFLLEAAALLSVATGDAARGLRLAGAAFGLRSEMDTPPTPVWQRELSGWLARGREQLGAAADGVWAAGLEVSAEAAVADALAEAPPNTQSLPNDLTRREAEVLRMLASGSTNKEIAAHLSVSVATVERHLANLYPKIGARSRTEATAFAISRGLVVASQLREPT